MVGGEVGNRVPLKHEVVLIKVSSFCNDHLLGDRVVKLPALVCNGLAPFVRLGLLRFLKSTK